MISPGRGAPACPAGPAEKPQRLAAVGDDVEAVALADLEEGLADHEGVAGVVFDQQHVDMVVRGPGHGISSSLQDQRPTPVTIPRAAARPGASRRRPQIQDRGRRVRAR